VFTALGIAAGLAGSSLSGIQDNVQRIGGVIIVGVEEDEHAIATATPGVGTWGRGAEPDAADPRVRCRTASCARRHLRTFDR